MQTTSQTSTAWTESWRRSKQALRARKLRVKHVPAAAEAIAIAIVVGAVVAAAQAAVPEATVAATPAAAVAAAEGKISSQLPVIRRAAAMRPFLYTADCEKCAKVRGRECPRHTGIVRKTSV
jgi:hypothetical protein